MTRLEHLKAEAIVLRRISRAVHRLADALERDFDRLTVQILRHEFRLKVGNSHGRPSNTKPRAPSP